MDGKEQPSEDIINNLERVKNANDGRTNPERIEENRKKLSLDKKELGLDPAKWRKPLQRPLKPFYKPDGKSELTQEQSLSLENPSIWELILDISGADERYTTISFDKSHANCYNELQPNTNARSQTVKQDVMNDDSNYDAHRTAYRRMKNNGPTAKSPHYCSDAMSFPAQGVTDVEEVKDPITYREDFKQESESDSNNAERNELEKDARSGFTWQGGGKVNAAQYFNIEDRIRMFSLDKAILKPPDGGQTPVADSTTDIMVVTKLRPVARVDSELSQQITNSVRKNHDVDQNVEDEDDAEITECTPWLTSSIITEDGGEIEIGGCRVRFQPKSFQQISEVWAYVRAKNSELPDGYIGITPVLYIEPELPLLKPATVWMRPWCVSDDSPDSKRVTVDIIHQHGEGSKWEVIATLPLGRKRELKFHCHHFSPVRGLMKKHSPCKTMVAGYLQSHEQHKLHLVFFVNDQAVKKEVKKEIGYAPGKDTIFSSVLIKSGDYLQAKLICQDPKTLKYESSIHKFIIDDDFQLQQSIHFTSFLQSCPTHSGQDTCHAKGKCEISRGPNAFLVLNQVQCFVHQWKQSTSEDQASPGQPPSHKTYHQYAKNIVQNSPGANITSTNDTTNIGEEEEGD